MAELSISRAWEEAKGRIAADGRLIAVVAAALIVLPGLVMGVVSPRSAASEPSLWSGIVILISSLVAVVGQLAIIRLAIGPAVSVGEAIGHGARRMPIYFLAGILIVIGLILAAIPFALVISALGVPLEGRAIAVSPAAILVCVLYAALVCFIAIRMLMTSPVASEEDVGPIAILRRSWALTSGHWWRLFGFILLLLVAALIAMAATNWAAALVAVVVLGPIEPMSGSALLVALAEAVVNTLVTVLLAVMLARIYLQLAGRESARATVPKSGT